MNKNYTSVEQSQKLIKFGINKTTSDMHYDKHPLENYYSPIPIIGKYSEIHDQLPCWSLAALLNVLPSATLDSSDDHHYRIHCMGRYTEWYDNAIDACYEMILKLHELKNL